MEITNEIKAVSQYYGTDFLVCYNIEKTPVVEKLNFKHLEFYEPDPVNKRDLLILKPISAITDEDAIEVGKFWYENFNLSEDAKLLIQRVKQDLSDPKIMLPFEAGQFLQSRGYDLPNYLLDGKTLQEAGLAIYDNHPFKATII